MTHQAHRAYRKHPRWAWAAALISLAAVALAVVLPAIGAANDVLPSSTGAEPNVIPTLVNVGGSNFSCSNPDPERVLPSEGKPVGLNPFKISKPSAGSYTDPATGVTFVITNDKTGSERQKYFSFSVSGADVFHVGVNGGTNSVWYDYVTASSTGVPSDGNLHATLDNKGTLYNASVTTFCFVPRTTTISGKVYLDRDGAGDFDDGSDIPLGGWTVSLFKTSGTPNSAKPNATSETNGTYSFTEVPVGADYRVCVTPPSGNWRQTTPPGNTACPAPALPAGVIVAPLLDAKTDADFGNQAITRLPDTACTDPFAGQSLSDGVSYSAQIVADGDCKTGDVVMYTYRAGTELIASLHPTSTGGTEYKVVEHIHWEDLGSDQNLVNLVYDDDPVGGYGDSVKAMKLCDSDRRPDKADFEFEAGETFGGILPSGGETSCILTKSDSAGGVYDAWIFSSVDGFRAGG